MNKYFCTIPWVHLHNWPDGRVFTCRTSLREYTNLGNLYDSSIEEIWNNKELKQLRKDMLAGVPRSDVCDRCYQNENLGVLSLRQYANERFYDEFLEQSKHETVPVKLYYWDFRFDNTCNQACRTCGPALSSSWVEDSYKITGKRIKGTSQFVKFNKDNTNTKIIQEHISHVKEINFAGGEPILTQDHYYILNELLARNRAKEVSFTYVTSLTTLKYKDMNMLDVWPKFKEVSVGISLDDIGLRAEYWRHNTNWDKFVNNLKSVKELSISHPNIKLNFFITVSVFNVNQISKIIKFLLENNLLDNDNIVYMYSVLGYVEFLEITTLPEQYKQQVIKQLEEAKILLGNHPSISNIDSLILKLSQPITDYKQELKCMASMFKNDFSTEVTPEAHRKKAAKHFAMLDKIRNQSVKDIAPELYEIYKDYGYDEEFINFKPYE